MAPKGPARLEGLQSALGDDADGPPVPVRQMGEIHLARIARVTDAIERLADDLEAASKTDEALRRLRTAPAIGPVTAGAVAAFAPDLDTVESGRDFAARLGLGPRQRSTGGKAELGAVSETGQTDIGRLLIVGASCRRRAFRATSVIRRVVRKRGSPNRWQVRLVARKPETVAAVALANKMARMIRATMTRGEDYRMA